MELKKSVLYGGGRRAAHPQPQAGRRAAHPKPQAGRREASPTAGLHRYLRLQASAVLQTVIDECSSPRTEVRGYRKYRLSGELCPTWQWRPAGAIGGSHHTALCAPLWALAWGDAWFRTPCDVATRRCIAVRML